MSCHTGWQNQNLQCDLHRSPMQVMTTLIQKISFEMPGGAADQRPTILSHNIKTFSFEQKTCAEIGIGAEF